MGISENITTSLLILVVFMGAALAYTGISAKNKVAIENSFNEFAGDKKLNNLFNTALLTTETSTGKQFGDLLASSIYYRTEMINISGNMVNVTKEFDNLLKQILIDKEYYFEITPKFTDINLLFIMSSEPRLEPTFAVLERDLLRLLANIGESYQNVNITGNIFIVEGMELCLSTKLDCMYYTEYDIYHNNFSTDIETLKYRYDFTRPGVGLSMTNDWETAQSYHFVTLNNTNMANFEIVFPIIDSLPGASDSQKCPTTYANDIINRDNKIIKDLGFIVNPIIVDNGDPDFCQAQVFSHAKNLIKSTKGVATPYSQNFLSDIHKIINKNIDSITIKSGINKYQEKRVIQSDLQLPNGETSIIRLHIYS
jgi:hypothetical protein